MHNCKTIGQQYQSGDFDIKSSRLESLIGCPQHITGDINCSVNWLSSLVGGPQRVDGYYNCSNNRLTDLVGCASHIGLSLYCYNNNITSLVGIHKIIKSCQSIEFDPKKITEGGIGLLMIGGMSYISSDTPPFEIIKSYLGTGTKGMMECSKELMSKGHTKYTKL